MTRIEEERIDEMLAGLESVTPGPWASDRHFSIGPRSQMDDQSFAMMLPIADIFGGNQTADTDHIARCDPDTIRSILTELKELRAQGGVRVAPLEWHDVLSPREDGPAEPSGDYEASNGLGSFYYIRCYFGSDSYGWEVSFDANAVSDHDNPEDAKASAFEHHKRNVLSALEIEAVEPVAWRCEDLILPSVSIIDDKAHAEARMRRPNEWRVAPLYTHPPHSSIPTVTDEMISKGADALHKMYHGSEDEPFHLMSKAVLTAALSSESKP